MKITVFCKPNAKIPKVEKVDEVTYRVAVKAAPEDGEANEAVRKVLADYFKVPITKVLNSCGTKITAKDSSYQRERIAVSV